MQDHDLGQIAARASEANPPHDLSLDLDAQFRVLHAVAHIVGTAFERPRRKLDCEVTRGVGILIDGDVNAAGTRLIDHAERVDAFAPAPSAHHLVMGDLRGQSAPFADRNRLLHRLNDIPAFAANV